MLRGRDPDRLLVVVVVVAKARRPVSDLGNSSDMLRHACLSFGDNLPATIPTLKTNLHNRMSKFVNGVCVPQESAEVLRRTLANNLLIIALGEIKKHNLSFTEAYNPCFQLCMRSEKQIVCDTFNRMCRVLWMQPVHTHKIVLRLFNDVGAAFFKFEKTGVGADKFFEDQKVRMQPLREWFAHRRIEARIRRINEINYAPGGRYALAAAKRFKTAIDLL